MLINILLLLIGFIFTFFVPGFLIIETFFYELPLLQKIPLNLLISVFVSTYTIYFTSLIWGFSRNSILFTFLIFLIWLIIFLLNRKLKINISVLKTHFAALFISLIIFILFLITLYPAIFSYFKNYYVLSAVNWQDTAMHLSIIESIAQGNFPPQAPYFSGHPLDYYYFIDFHSAILQVLYGDFLPQILVYDNPFFVLIFFLSIYALSYDFFKSRLSGIIAGLLAVFCGNFFYYKFFQDVYKNLSLSTNFLSPIINQIMNNGYTLDYNNLMQMSPVTDYFLQNRPMMIGLPTITLLILLNKKGFEKNSMKYFLLSGLLTAMLIKFQLFALGVSILIFLISSIIFKGSLQQKTKKAICFFSIITVLTLLSFFIFTSNNYVVSAFMTNFSLGVWDKTKNSIWYIAFPFANFGVLAFLFLLFALLIFLRKINLTREIVFLIILSLILYLIPHLIFFTIYNGDMLKFFYFLLIPLSLISALMLRKVWEKLPAGPIIVILLILISSFNSFLTLASSYLNKYAGYSQADYQAGIWIRKNTMPNSVFMTMPTIHSAVSDIGGRLRVLSYTVWPYSHGFNQGIDNVFTREANIESVYQNPTDTENTKKVLNLYRVNYIYLGPEENNKFYFAKQIFGQLAFLQLIYDLSGIQIYKVL